MTPRVSICVPNLNTRPFLPERFATIFEQSFQDWELLVYDGYSDDGAWEFIQALAAREPRITAWQGPREGTPASWNPCVRKARGEYVYVATSDDTMPADCLERLVRALDEHPECDIAHCRLEAIDEQGRVIPEIAQWWSEGPFAASSGPLLGCEHVRRAPFDGLLHLLGGSVYVSITQLLIRRSLFNQIGGFDSAWGSIGDFAWSMRAALVANTVHVPATWGGWRVHSRQATAAVHLNSEEHAQKIDGMIEDAVARCELHLYPPVRAALARWWLNESKERRALVRELSRRSDLSLVRRRAYIAGRACRSRVAREYVRSRLLGRPSVEWVQRRLEAAGVQRSLFPAAMVGHPHRRPAA